MQQTINLEDFEKRVELVARLSVDGRNLYNKTMAAVLKETKTPLWTSVREWWHDGQWHTLTQNGDYYLYCVGDEEVLYRAKKLKQLSLF